MEPYLPALAVIIWAFIHSYFADSRVKLKIENIFGDLTPRWYRLIYVLLSVISLGGIGWLLYTQQGSTVWSIKGSVKWILIAVKLSAAVLLIISAGRTEAGDFLGYGRIKGKVETPRLDVSGLYRFVRHPLYFLGFIIIWAAPSMSVGALALSAAASLYLWLGTYHEEKGLREAFGDEYVEYARLVPRLIPRFRHFQRNRKG